MFQFAADLNDGTGGIMMVMVLEEEDLPKLGTGTMLVVRPPGPADGATKPIVQCGIYFTRQTMEEFLAEMRKAGVLHGTTLIDNRAKPSKFAEPYEAGVKSRVAVDAIMPIDPEKNCPYLSGEKREHWLLGWHSEDQRRMNQSFKRG